MLFDGERIFDRPITEGQLTLAEKQAEEDAERYRLAKARHDQTRGPLRLITGIHAGMRHFAAFASTSQYEEILDRSMVEYAERVAPSDPVDLPPLDIAVI